jgi:hypothetical protein
VARGLKDAIQVEWVNVTYRSVMTGLLVLLVLGLGAGASWYYAYRYAPRGEAEEAIRRANNRLTEAAALPADERVEELLGNAQVSLEVARDELGEHDYADAAIAAVRSENFSLKVIAMAGGEAAKARLVRFYRIEGDVRVKQGGEFSWKAADPRMVLRIGDQVKTSSTASAELIYFDGTVTTIHPGSLLEIRDLYEDPVTKVRRVREKLTWGELRASTQEHNVTGSYHEVATEKVAARAEGAGEFRVAYDRGKQTAVIDVFDGRIEVATPGSRQAVEAGERVKAQQDGRLAPKETLPGVPRLLSPSDQRVFIFEDPLKEELALNWEPTPGCQRYRLMISDRSLFTRPLYDAEREGGHAVVAGIASGSYYWRVAAISPDGVEGPFSPARRFRVSSQRIRDRTDTEPPKLEVNEFVPIGQMVIINGQTEPGATLWVDSAKVDVYEDGSFNTVVKLRREGQNELVLVAQDTAGNESTLRRTAFVELY